jgi:hypothetical protein
MSKSKLEAEWYYSTSTSMIDINDIRKWNLKNPICPLHMLNSSTRKPYLVGRLRRLDGIRLAVVWREARRQIRKHWRYLFRLDIAPPDRRCRGAPALPLPITIPQAGGVVRWRRRRIDVGRINGGYSRGAGAWLRYCHRACRQWSLRGDEGEEGSWWDWLGGKAARVGKWNRCPCFHACKGHVAWAIHRLVGPSIISPRRPLRNVDHSLTHSQFGVPIGIIMWTDDRHICKHVYHHFLRISRNFFLNTTHLNYVSMQVFRFF